MGEIRLRLRFADCMDNVLGYYLPTHFRQGVIVQRVTTPRGCFRLEAEATFYQLLWSIFTRSHWSKSWGIQQHHFSPVSSETNALQYRTDVILLRWFVPGFPGHHTACLVRMYSVLSLFPLALFRNPEELNNRHVIYPHKLWNFQLVESVECFSYHRECQFKSTQQQLTFSKSYC